MAKKNSKKRKMRKRNFVSLIILVCIILAGLVILDNLKITTINVSGNSLYEEWEIIKKAKLDNYPSTLQNLTGTIEERLEKDPYIKKVKVTKILFTKVNIEIEENLPLFYYVPIHKTVLSDKTETDSSFPVPTVINYIPDKIYSKFLKSLSDTDYEIVKKISEIKYDPNEVDQERFILTMNDGNYVYLTLKKFDKINNYLYIIKEFNNKKGILYLDSGEYFKVIE